MAALVFMDPQIGGGTCRRMGHYLQNNVQLDGRVVRVVNGRGRHEPVEEMRDADWQRTFSTFTQYGELDADSFDKAEAEGVTINTYGSLTPSTGNYDIMNMPYETLLPDTGYQSEPVYDCLQVEDSTEGELFWEFPDEEYIHFGGEFTHRVITFLVPFIAVRVRDEFAWELVIEDAIIGCLDPEGAANRESRLAERNIERFIAIGNERDDGELRNIRTRITDGGARLIDAQRTEESSRQELREAQELLDAVLARRDDGGVNSESLLAEYEAINRHAHVVSCSWAGNHTFIVRTDNLMLTHPTTGEERELGVFTIKFDFRRSIITLNNMTNKRGAFDHPHVNNGQMCTGEIGPSLTRLMQQRQIGSAVNMALAALGMVNMEDDWGRHVEWWFGAEDAPDPTVTG